METSDDSDAAALHLDESRAIVLFELLSRWLSPGEGGNLPDACCEHPSERIVLRDLLAQLEQRLVTPFREDYEKLLSEAREAVLTS